MAEAGNSASVWEERGEYAEGLYYRQDLYSGSSGAPGGGCCYDFRMLSLLLLAVLQAAPDAAGRDRQYAAALASARAVWESCLDDASSKWAARPEDPLTIAAGVLGRCQREEAGVRDAINAITRVLDRNRVDEIMDRERAHARERAVAKILALRPLPASQRR